ncbi:uncharacterized protein LOC142626904 [Castanea sativa]|uniref:uncharacterized protein LOC142626904 n=1 Tax=Castanea sativa TaxID=21020 RepID=UPI003F64AD99
MDRFQEVVDLCQFRDLGYMDARYTWSRHFENGDSVWARLDRALTNEGWMRKFANARVVHISAIESDHCMLCLQWGGDTRSRMKTGKLFRFEAMWLCDPCCPEVVSEAWERGLSCSSGFPIHNCLQSCRINGQPKGRIIPSRGLRQDDPFSPYLFSLCVEGLSGLLRQQVERGNIKGVAVCRAAPLSGQQLNRYKTALFFNRNTPRPVQEEIQQRFGVLVIRQHEKYLGLPSLVGRSKRNTFNDLKEKLGNKLSGWKEKLLSSVVKEILIKSVAQAIPSYTMSCFKLPDALCDELAGMVRRFWWGQQENPNKLAWLSWDKMCASKEEEGMRFRDLKAFNIALLAKQGWRLQNCPNSLFCRVYKAKYFPHGDFLSASLGRHPSYSWCSIMEAQKVFQLGCWWQIGNGGSVRLWSDKWLPFPSLYKPATVPHFFPDDAMVSALINPKTATWKSDIIHEVFLPIDAKTILSIPLSPSLPADIWASTPTGRFSVSSAYRVARQVRTDTHQGESSSPQLMVSFWWCIWKLPLPDKIKAFSLDNVCEECGTVESSAHVLWHCARAKEVWTAANVDFGSDLGEVREFIDLLWYARNMKQWSAQDLAQLFVIAWGIWPNRNEVRASGLHKSASVIAGWTMEYLEEFQLANHRIQMKNPRVEVGWALP